MHFTMLEQYHHGSCCWPYECYYGHAYAVPIHDEVPCLYLWAYKCLLCYLYIMQISLSWCPYLPWYLFQMPAMVHMPTEVLQCTYLPWFTSHNVHTCHSAHNSHSAYTCPGAHTYHSVHNCHGAYTFCSVYTCCGAHTYRAPHTY